jgi:hypothetical protein
MLVLPAKSLSLDEGGVHQSFYSRKEEIAIYLLYDLPFEIIRK